MHLKGISGNDCWFIFPPLKTPVWQIISLILWMSVQKYPKWKSLKRSPLNEKKLFRVH
jgi:hypothetical protein